MRIYQDIVTLLPAAELWDRGQIVSPSAKRGDGDPLEIQFHRNGVPERLPAGTLITFIIKTAGKFDQNPALVECILTDANRPASDAGFYTATPIYNTAPLNAAFRSGDGIDTNDVPTVLGSGEISWIAPTPGSLPKSSKTFTVSIENDVFKGDENPPVPILGSGLLAFPPIDPATPLPLQKVRLSATGHLELYNTNSAQWEILDATSCLIAGTIHKYSDFIAEANKSYTISPSGPNGALSPVAVTLPPGCPEGTVIELIVGSGWYGGVTIKTPESFDPGTLVDLMTFTLLYGSVTLVKFSGAHLNTYGWWPILPLDSRMVASKSVAEAGTDETSYMTPLRTAQAIAARTGGITSNPTGITGAQVITNIVKITQTAYNALASVDANVTYIILPG